MPKSSWASAAPYCSHDSSRIRCSRSACCVKVNSKVLVTECTFLDKDEEQMAHKKGHTHLKSIVKALNELGDDVKCEQIVLTHFSMKYSEKHILETLESEIPERFRERVIAFI